MNGLYAIVDIDTLNQQHIDPLHFAATICRTHQPVALQLRAKNLGACETLELLRALKPICQAAGVPLFANDRADLAALAGCDGLHLGQHDLPIAQARQLLPQGCVLGLSIHRPSELQHALQAPAAAQPDYLAFGPVFPTRSKANPDPHLGLAGLRQLVEQARPSGLPCVAIGGINTNNRAEVSEICPGVAMISGLLLEYKGS